MEYQGMRTRNEKGLFEVHFSVDTGLLGKVFKRKSEYKYYTESLNTVNWESFAHCSSGLVWLDEDMNIVKSLKTLSKIEKILVQAKYNSL